MSNWISVKDRLPNNSNEVIVFCLDDVVTTGKYIRVSKDKYLWKAPIYSPYIDNNLNVTHWQPLPEPPKNIKE